MNRKSDLSKLPNIGLKMERYLLEAGIASESDLRQAGPVEAFLRLAMLSSHLRNRMALYALYGALTGQNCLYLPQETKDWLEDELQKAGYDG